jgi:CHAT domain-containing protein
LIALVARGGSDAIERIELGTSAQLRAVLDPWRERLARSPGPRARPGDRSERECRRLGREVRALVWDRIAPHLAEAKDVYLVADGPLLDLPWQALPDGASAYLVETGMCVHVLNAERELIERRRTPSGSLLAIGAPDYDLGARQGSPTLAAAWVRAAPDPCAAGWLPTFAPLPGSGQEAVVVGREWRAEADHQATVLLGAEANERMFKHEARGRAIIHLATHGMVAGDLCAPGSAGLRGVGGIEALKARPDPHPTAAMTSTSRPPSQASAAPAPSPWLARRVWLALAGANHAHEYQADENEGLLTAEEVITLDLEGTDWVVLSACHSGLAEAWSREGTLGMRRAFDLAGARTVIASQWAVADDATREWMQALYTARARGASTSAAALQSASREILASRRKAGRSTHPFYWAAFSASGE